LNPALLPGLDAAAYTDLTPIQALSLPPILEGRDLIAQAPTGSGKTVAFGLGLLQRIDPALVRVQALVLCPTRELADQVAKEIRKLAIGVPNLKLLILCGGIPLRPQLASLSHDPHVVVGTPGRIQELLRKKALHLGGVRTLVLDEADRMLDMGFADAIKEIVGRTNKARQSLLFSATFADAIRELANAMLRDPLELTVDGSEQQPAIRQLFFEAEPSNKQLALGAILASHKPASAVVFCNTRRDTEEVATSLCAQGFAALALHGEIDQRERDEILVRFGNGSCQVLVATDVAGRGLDIKDLGAVVNYELPTNPEDHLHRIGRTGRMGKDGLALSLVSSRERPRAQAIEAAQGAPLAWRKLPTAVAKNSVSAPMVTLCIDAGRTEKIRPGDILGALTGDAGLPASAVGKIDIFATRAYVAVGKAQAKDALARLQAGKIKGRKLRVRKIG
jgi:ATP-independent RNA helicase DbpA